MGGLAREGRRSQRSMVAVGQGVPSGTPALQPGVNGRRRFPWRDGSDDWGLTPQGSQRLERRRALVTSPARPSHHPLPITRQRLVDPATAPGPSPGFAPLERRFARRTASAALGDPPGVV